MQGQQGWGYFSPSLSLSIRLHMSLLTMCWYSRLWTWNIQCIFFFDCPQASFMYWWFAPFCRARNHRNFDWPIAVAPIPQNENERHGEKYQRLLSAGLFYSLYYSGAEIVSQSVVSILLPFLLFSSLFLSLARIAPPSTTAAAAPNFCLVNHRHVCYLRVTDSRYNRPIGQHAHKYKYQLISACCSRWQQAQATQSRTSLSALSYEKD